jgi:pimeloyl-ACP methyl ester carboxylesterase
MMFMNKTMTDSIQTKEELPGKFAPVNGLQLYYELYGSGQPLVVLHGGVGASEMFGPNLPAFSATCQVIAVHLQGHGRTADIDRPLSYELMADDISAMLKYLKISQADILGYSLGGGVALQTAIRHHEVVRKLVVISTPARRAGWYPEVLEGFDQMGPEAARYMDQSPLFQLYPDVKWAKLFTKLGEMMREDYDWTREVAAIRLPMLMAFADADAVRMEHILEFFGLLGGGQRDAGMDGSLRPAARLTILPGLTHYDIGVSPSLAAVIMPFLDAPMPKDGSAGITKI